MNRKAERLLRARPLRASNGIAFDTDDAMYESDMVPGHVRRRNPAGRRERSACAGDGHSTPTRHRRRASRAPSLGRYEAGLSR